MRKYWRHLLVAATDRRFRRRCWPRHSAERLAKLWAVRGTRLLSNLARSDLHQPLLQRAPLSQPTTCQEMGRARGRPARADEARRGCMALERTGHELSGSAAVEMIQAENTLAHHDAAGLRKRHHRANGIRRLDQRYCPSLSRAGWSILPALDDFDCSSEPRPSERYSCRSVTTGSNRAAWRAGQ